MADSFDVSGDSGDAGDAVAPITGTVVTIDGLLANCRLQPTTASLVIARLPNGTPIEILGPTVDGWVPVTCDDKAGFIFMDLIQRPPEP